MSLHDAPGTSQDAPATHRYVPMGEAVSILGVSASTIRRRIDAGELDAERVPRPQGTALLVKVPGTSQDTPGAHQDAPETSHHAPGGTEYLTAITATLVAEITASRQTIERQAEHLVAQAETIGRQAAELEALRSQPSTLSASGSSERPDPSSWPSLPQARAWAVYGAMLLVLVAGLGLVLMLGPTVWR